MYADSTTASFATDAKNKGKAEQCVYLEGLSALVKTIMNSVIETMLKSEKAHYSDTIRVSNRENEIVADMDTPSK